MTLETAEVSVMDLYKQGLKNADKKHSPGLKSFALTLNYYSPKAYGYVRKTLNMMNLPHPRALRKWYQSKEGIPGFTKESLEAIKVRVRNSEKPLYCCVMMAEMEIDRKIEWDGKGFYGHIDFGDNTQHDLSAEASEALVFFVTCINESFKLPVGYFLVDKTSSEQKKNLLVTCLEQLNDTGISVVALTFDACISTLSLATLLGCSFEPNNMKTTFPHPSTKEPIAVFLDPTHMLKMVRNAFRQYQVLINSQGEAIKWNFLDKLNDFKLQEIDTVRRGQKMKVNLAIQLLSETVAEDLAFFRNYLSLDEFKESSGTSEFIKTMNSIFDIMNSRTFNTSKEYYFKKPLNVQNEDEVFDFLELAETYIKELKSAHGHTMVTSGGKTGFIGFLTCIQSIRKLYHYLVDEQRLSVLPMYRLSLRHLELFFHNVRSHYGIYNPSAKQFKAYYQKLLPYLEIHTNDDGDYVRLQHIPVMHCSSAVDTINATTIRRPLVEDLKDDFRNSDHSYLEKVFTTISNFSVYAEEIIENLSRNVVTTLLKKLKCEDCVGALLTDEYREVVKISRKIESIIENMYLAQNFKPKKIKTVIVCRLLEHFIATDVFNTLNLHQFNQEPTENHLVLLVVAVTETYINVRYDYFTKQMPETVKPPKTKKQASKYVWYSDLV